MRTTDELLKQFKKIQVEAPHDKEAQLQYWKKKSKKQRSWTKLNIINCIIEELEKEGGKT